MPSAWPTGSAPEGFNVEAYTSESGERRPDLEQALLKNDIKALVATTATWHGLRQARLGVRLPFPSPRFRHPLLPASRQGRPRLDAAHGSCSVGPKRSTFADYFITSAFPSRQDVEQLTEALRSAPEGLSRPQLQQRLNIRPGRIDKALQLLSLESPAPIVKDGPKWRLTPSRLGEAFWERVERLTALRRQELDQMRKYVSLDSGHMEFLIRALDGDPASAATPTFQPLPAAVDAGLTREGRNVPARRQHPTSIHANSGRRASCPTSLLGPSLSNCGLRPERRYAGTGTSAGLNWCATGNTARTLLDELVDACVQMMREWAPSPTPAWVVPVPSLRRPELVPEFAQRLAEALGLPCYPVLERTQAHPEQKQMENSPHQAHNVLRSLGLRSSPPAAPALPG